MQKSLIKSKIKKNLKKEKDEDTFKCILLGDPNVGKTAVVTRYVDDRFSQHHLTTIGIDMKNKTQKIERDKEVNLTIWDTAGQERFQTITSVYFNRAQGIIMIFDCTDMQSFLNIKNWTEQISNHVDPEQVVIVLLGNKIDLAESDREVSHEEAKTLEKNHEHIKYFEVSAKTGENVEEVFKYACQ